MSSMRNGSNGFLVDTNVLVYAYDLRDRNKHERATLALGAVIGARRAVLSVQCLSEFFNVTTRRLPEPLTREQALTRIERLSYVCRVLDLTPAVVLEGCSGTVRHGLSIWDALIWAAAKMNQVPYVLTEDAPHERFLEGVRFLNPFVPDFDLRILDLGS